MNDANKEYFNSLNGEPFTANIKPGRPPESMLIHGDCIEAMKSINDSSIDAVVTDPPYLLTSGGFSTDSSTLQSNMRKTHGYKNDGDFFNGNCPPFTDWVGEIFRVVKTDFYMMVNDKNVYAATKAALDVGFKLHNIIIWDKCMKIVNRWYMKQVEYILYFWKGKARNINNMGTANLLSIPFPKNKSHPTEKPVSLMRILIENSTDPGEVVFDPFMGSGTTGEACVITGRDFIGIEISEEYFKIAEKRIYEASLQPRLFA